MSNKKTSNRKLIVNYFIEDFGNFAQKNGINLEENTFKLSDVVEELYNPDKETRVSNSSEPDEEEEEEQVEKECEIETESENEYEVKKYWKNGTTTIIY